MLGHIFLSKSAFERILKLRFLGELRPTDDPQLIDGQECFLDGLEFTNVEVNQSPRQAQFTLNHVVPATGLVGPVAPPFPFSPVRVAVYGRVLFVSRASMEAASAVEADGRFALPERIARGFSNIELDVAFTVNEHGLPILTVTPLEVPGMPDLVRRIGSLSVPMPMDTAFAEALEPGKTRVLNAGLAMSGPNVVMRFEFEPVREGAATTAQRLADWQSFLAGNYPSRLDTPGRDWAIELPTTQILARAAKELDESMSSGDMAKHFTPTQPAWGTWQTNEAAFTLYKNGVFESLCSGLDVKAQFRSKVTLSVPADNVLRTAIDLTIDVDDIDAWKCIGVSLLNPLAGLITVFDHSDDLPWYAEIAGALIRFWPALAMVAWGLGLDDVATRIAIEEAQEKTAKDKPAIIRTSMSSFYTDSPKAVTTSMTRDWLVLENVSGAGDRLVLRGRYVQPDINTLPRLVGTLTEPFGAWRAKDRCSSHPTWVTTATLALTIEEPEGTAVPPIVSVRYGGDIEVVDNVKVEVGQITWRVVKDPANDYQYPRALVHWTGIPGLFEVEVKVATQIYSGTPGAVVFLGPKPMHVQFFTNYGVREFEVPAPPASPVLTPQEAKIHALERANECYIFSTILTRVKALQVLWLPTPQPHFDEAQHWQVILGGLPGGRRVRAWDADAGRLLAEIETLHRITEISLVARAGRPVRRLQLTLDDQRPLSVDAYLGRVSRMRGRAARAETWVLIRQTPLRLAARIALGTPTHTLAAEPSAHTLRLFTRGPAGESTICVDLRNPANAAIRMRPGGGSPGDPGFDTSPADRGIAIAPRLGPKETQAGGRYFARPWFDRGQVAGGYLARLSDDGTVLELFSRGLTREAWPERQARHRAAQAKAPDRCIGGAEGENRPLGGRRSGGRAAC